MEIILALPFLKSFVYVVEHESFAKAARKLSTTTSTISKHINKLEEILGLQLLIRTTRKMSLTDPGIRFYEQCKRILEEVDLAEDMMTQMHKAPSGRLNVVCGRYFAKTYLVPHLKEFLEIYPFIYLNLELAERMPDFESEDVDVLLGMSVPIEEGNIIQRRIMSTKYVFTASPAYLQLWGIPKHPRDLGRHRYLTHSMRKPNSLLYFKNEDPVQVRPYLQVNDAETLLQLTLQGLGIMKTHEYVVREAIDNGQLIEVLNSFSEEQIPIFLAYSQRRILSQKIRCFIDFVTERIPRESL